MNYLDAKNCNKTKCKTCIFREDGSGVKLSPKRVAEIHQYLIECTATHICHTTNKSCYGGLELQARAMYARGLTPEPTVESLLSTAKQILNP